MSSWENEEERILNGSPRKQNTAAMVEAFAEGAKAAGHEVETIQVGKLKINGCLACEYCHGRGRASASRRTTWRRSCPPIRRVT